MPAFKRPPGHLAPRGESVAGLPNERVASAENIDRKPDYIPYAGFRVASPNFLFGASNPAVCNVWGSPELAGNLGATRHCGVILSTP